MSTQQMENIANKAEELISNNYRLLQEAKKMSPEDGIKYLKIVEMNAKKADELLQSLKNN